MSQECTILVTSWIWLQKVCLVTLHSILGILFKCGQPLAEHETRDACTQLIIHASIKYQTYRAMFASVISPSLIFQYRPRMTLYSFSVHLLISRTWMVGLTLAPEGSGSLVKPQPVYAFLQLRSCSHWGCRMSENNRWELVQQTPSFCV